MKNSHKYIISVLVLLLLSAAVLTINTAQHFRPLQHETYNTEVEDNNLSIEANSFTSRLPVVSIDTRGEAIPGRPESGQRVEEVEETYSSAQMKIYEEQNDLNSLQNTPVLDHNVNIRIRGNSSRRFDKPGYLIKFIDEEEKKSSQEVLGMGAHDTWVLHGPFVDKTLMRNYMWYNLSGQIMDWAPKASYCEVFVDNEYQGVYVMIEQISVGEGRLNLKEKDPRYAATSYIVRMDRPDVEEHVLDNFSRYSLKTNNEFDIKYPKSSDVDDDVIEYISKDLSEFEKAIYSYDYDSFRFGYSKFIDTQSFIDYMLINEVTQNLDAGSYSTYVYKDLSGKLKPVVWDFNNCTDNYIEDSLTTEGFFIRTKLWFYMLTKDDDFNEHVIRRYNSLRKNVLSDENLEKFIDETIDYLGYAIDRNYQVWDYTFDPKKDMLEDGRKIGSYEEAISQYRNTLFERVDWLDNNIDVLYSYSHDSVNKKFNH